MQDFQIYQLDMGNESDCEIATILDRAFGPWRLAINKRTPDGDNAVSTLDNHDGNPITYYELASVYREAVRRAKEIDEDPPLRHFWGALSDDRKRVVTFA